MFHLSGMTQLTFLYIQCGAGGFSRFATAVSVNTLGQELRLAFDRSLQIKGKARSDVKGQGNSSNEALVSEAGAEREDADTGPVLSEGDEQVEGQDCREEQGNKDRNEAEEEEKERERRAESEEEERRQLERPYTYVLRFDKMRVGAVVRAGVLSGKSDPVTEHEMVQKHGNPHGVDDERAWKYDCNWNDRRAVRQVWCRSGVVI